MIIYLFLGSQRDAIFYFVRGGDGLFGYVEKAGVATKILGLSFSSFFFLIIHTPCRVD